MFPVAGQEGGWDTGKVVSKFMDTDEYLYLPVSDIISPTMEMICHSTE